MRHFVFFAFGTIGDVQPLSIIAAALARASPLPAVTFITHASHEAALKERLQDAAVACAGVASPPVALRAQQGLPAGAAAAQPAPPGAPAAGLPPGPPGKRSSSPIERPDCGKRRPVQVEASTGPQERSPGARGPPAEHARAAEVTATQPGRRPGSGEERDGEEDEGWGREREAQHRGECRAALAAAVGRQPAPSSQPFIVFNLFALEAWHLAERFGLPCAAAAPYVVPYSAPAAFERRFRAAHPRLYHALKRARPGQLGWPEVEHWMWPLFTERWAAWREDALGLSPCPLLDKCTGLPLPSHQWPSAPRLLYGFSSSVVECPGYWPASIAVCGFWSPPSAAPGYRPPTGLERFLEAPAAAPPICVGFSSIGSMGLLEHPASLVAVVLAATAAAGLRAVLLTGGDAGLGAACVAAACTKDVAAVGPEKGDEHKGQRAATKCALLEGLLLGGGRVLCLGRPVPYEWLLPRCCMAMHHAGSGTTAAALRAGIPQVCCPFLFDQFYWAERMAWIGVAPEPLAPRQLMPPPGCGPGSESATSAVAAAMEAASSLRVKRRAAELGEEIRREDGVTGAVDILLAEEAKSVQERS